MQKMQNITCMKQVHHRPTQSMTYLHCPIARFQEFVLLNVQYKRKTSCFQHDYAVLVLLLNSVDF